MSRPFPRALFGVGICSFMAATAAAFQPITFTSLGLLPGGATSSAAAVSADGGVVVGWGASPLSGSGFRAVRWTAATGIVDLGAVSPVGGSFGSGVSGDGTVAVGEVGVSTFAAARWTSSGVNSIGPLGSSAFGASHDGSIIVGLFDEGGSNRAFRWTKSTGVVSLGVLPGSTLSWAKAVSADGSTIVGNSGIIGARTAFRHNSTLGMVPLPLLPGGTLSFADGVSSDGSVIVGTGNSSSGDRAFRWTEASGTVSLGALPGMLDSHAFGVSGDGSMVVGYSGGAGQAAFLWTAAAGMQSIQDLLGSAVPSGWNLYLARAISADGTTIVGEGLFNGQTQGWIATIPSPASACALALGLALPRRRRG